ncbi:MAG: arsenate reductase (thioredoxin) [Thermaerobacter sp.]|nr:arsenate reductase (thioredoxin) [Thermaerobacter sp.]
MELPLIYFICTGNSARSQMAEGFARQMLRDSFEVLSGGLEPSSVNPYAVQAMAEVGIDISGQFSKPIDVDRLWSARIAVTLCGDAEERCPVTPPGVLRLHWPLRDPAKAIGTEEEKLAVFRSVGDQIREQIVELAAQR